jgi:transposase
VEIVYPRVAAIDVHKKQVTVAVRTPGERVGQRRQQVRKAPLPSHHLSVSGLP